MTWTHFDDAAAKNPKAVTVGNEAWALWVAAILYSNRFLTDGIVSVAALANDCLPVQITPQKAKKLAEQLCECRAKPDGKGLFERLPGGFYQVHDFLDWNPSKASIDEKRRLDRLRKRGVKPPESGGTNAGPPPESRRIPDGIPSGNQTESAENPNGVRATSEEVPPARARGSAPSEPSRAEPSRADPSRSEDPPKPPAGDFRLPRDWDPGAQVLDGTSVPPWAHPEMVNRFRAYHCNGDTARSATDWRQSFAKWACSEWVRNPPPRPAGAATPQEQHEAQERAAARRERDARQLERARRERDKDRVPVTVAAPASPEAAREALRAIKEGIGN